MNETPFYFSSDAEQLFAVLHEPTAAKQSLGWVFCHPFAEEKLWAHRVYVSLARDLAKLGYPVLRFDYRGYGDSTGLFEESTVDGQVTDIQRAIEVLQTKCPAVTAIGLLGLRYGATLAAIVAERTDTVKRLVLWDPVTDLGRYLMEALRANLTTQLVMHGKIVTKREELVERIMAGEMVNIDGYDLSKIFYESAQSVHLLPGMKKFPDHCQIVQIGRGNQTAKKELVELAATYANARLTLVAEEQFWKEIKDYIQRSQGLTDSLMAWLAGDSPA